jgi:hypothetical protein
MSGLSDVTILIGRHARDLERAQDVFRTEIGGFLINILAALRRARSEPWAQARVRIDVPRDVETENQAAGMPPSHFARAFLRFKKGTNFQRVAEVRFGVEFEESLGSFTWQIYLVPDARYQRMDDHLWNHWRAAAGQSPPPGSVHQAKSNTVRFVQRPIDKELTGDIAFNDVKLVLEALLSTDGPLAEAVGLDPED